VEAHLASNVSASAASAIIGTTGHRRPSLKRRSADDASVRCQLGPDVDGTDPGQVPRILHRVAQGRKYTTTAYNTYFGRPGRRQDDRFGYTYSTSTNSFAPILGAQPNPAPTLLGSTTNGCDYYLNNQANAAATASAVIAIDHSLCRQQRHIRRPDTHQAARDQGLRRPNYGGNFLRHQQLGL